MSGSGRIPLAGIYSAVLPFSCRWSFICSVVNESSWFSTPTKGLNLIHMLRFVLSSS